MEKDNFHIDMSGRIYENRTIGIALVATESDTHHGCALKGNLIKLIKKNLFGKNIYEDSAKLYAICISLLVKNVRKEIKTLIICNDEDFEIVKTVLNKLLSPVDFEIINITEFRKRLGRKVGSLADNYANIYRKKALKNRKGGKELKIVEINYNLIKENWEKVKI